MKKNRIIIPALGLIALGTAASITGTVAWFTANNSVQITGMTVKTQVGSNLLIANNTTSATFTDAAFATSLEQVRKAKLEPVSTIDALNYYYTTLANDNGTAKDSSAFYAYNESTAHGSADGDADKANYDASFNSRYGAGSVTAGYAGTVLYGYVDYTFYIKGSFTSVGDMLVMDKCNLLYDGAALTASDLSWRVGILAHAANATTTAGVTTVTTYTTAWADGDRVSILAPTGAAYNYVTNGTSNTDPDAVGGLGATRGDGNAQTYADVKDLSESAVIYTTTAENEANKVFKITVRLWLEGEDNKCYVDNYKTLTEEYTLDLGFRAVASGDTSAVTVIGSSAS